MEANPDERVGGHVATDGSNTSLEPMFNFRSLAAVIGDEDKGHESEHVEDASPQPEGSSSAAPSVNQTPAEPAKAEPVAGAGAEDHSTSVETKQEANVQQDSDVNLQLPKELETRSVEITTANPQAPS